MTPLSEGDRVIYVPDHVDGPESEYAEKGVVQQVRSTGVLVKYFDGSPNAKHTKYDQLVRADPSAPYE